MPSPKTASTPRRLMLAPIAHIGAESAEFCESVPPQPTAGSQWRGVVVGSLAIATVIFCQLAGIGCRQFLADSAGGSAEFPGNGVPENRLGATTSSGIVCPPHLPGGIWHSRVLSLLGIGVMPKTLFEMIAPFPVIRTVVFIMATVFSLAEQIGLMYLATWFLYRHVLCRLVRPLLYICAVFILIRVLLWFLLRYVE